MLFRSLLVAHHQLGREREHGVDVEVLGAAHRRDRGDAIGGLDAVGRAPDDAVARAEREQCVRVAAQAGVGKLGPRPDRSPLGV